MSKEVLRQRTDDYRSWVEAYARNHKVQIEWAEKGVGSGEVEVWRGGLGAA